MNELRWCHFSRLLWKDERLIRSLAIASIAGIVVLNLLGFLIGRFALDEPAGNLAAGVVIWYMLPFIFAIGAGTMLVGNEEESGTLSWMRNLPVSWSTVVTSKIAVATAWLVAIWIAATVMLGLQYAVTDQLSDHVIRDANLSFWKLAGALAVVCYFSEIVLLAGFVTSLMFRSPIAALVVLIVSAGFVASLFVYVSEKVLDASNQSYAAVSIANFLLVAILVGVVGFVANRRLSQPESSSLLQRLWPHSVDTYRQTANVRLVQPSVADAMLWQQFRQTFPIAVPCTFFLWIVAIAMALGGATTDGPGELEAFFFLMTAVSLCCQTFIGAMTFYGDSVRRRCAFFADRGISPTTVWWTRVAVSFGYLLAIAIPVLVIFRMQSTQLDSTVEIVTTAMCLLAGWSVAVFVSMLVKRAILSFFASLVVLSMSPGAFAWFFQHYENHVWTIVAITPIMLFASWRLCRFWINGEMGVAFYVRAAAYTALAIVTPMLLTLVSVYFT